MYADELSRDDRMRILIRVNYGYYVVERALMRCENEESKARLRDEVYKSLRYLGANNLKNKWVELVEKSRNGHLIVATSEGDQ